MTKRFWPLALLALAFAPVTGRADLPGKHPYYLHALADLRAANWMVEHRGGDLWVHVDEDVASAEIRGAIGDLKQAAIDDGKDIHDVVGVDQGWDHRGRLHHALDLLRKVRRDLSHEEDDRAARGLRNRTLRHVDKAIRATERAIHASHF
jgi:hypothetical protein